LFTINSRTFTKSRTTADAVTYAGPTDTLSVQDKLELKRVYPVPSKNGFKGVARPSLKQTRTVEINSVTGETGIATLQIIASFPVGMTDALIDAFLADQAAFLAHAAADSLFKQLLVEV
jgi:hypothetical protein